MLIPNAGILLLRLERRRLGLLCRDLPHAHQRACGLHLYSHAMALPIRHSTRFAHNAHGMERRVFLFLRELLGGYGVCGILARA